MRKRHRLCLAFVVVGVVVKGERGERLWVLTGRRMIVLYGWLEVGHVASCCDEGDSD